VYVNWNTLNDLTPRARGASVHMHHMVMQAIREGRFLIGRV